MSHGKQFGEDTACELTFLRAAAAATAAHVTGTDRPELRSSSRGTPRPARRWLGGNGARELNTTSPKLIFMVTLDRATPLTSTIEPARGFAPPLRSGEAAWDNHRSEGLITLS